MILPRSGEQAGKTHSEPAVRTVIHRDEHALHIGNKALGFERLARDAGLLLIL